MAKQPVPGQPVTAGIRVVPLAGVPLTFDVTVVGVRAATKQELKHGHAHGSHGHDH